jgi:site-specific DNA-methyltransferase (adenine-specific)
MIQLIQGDCLIESDKIESGSVDLILTDLPYGTVKGLGGDIEKYKRLSNSDWDNVIDTNKIMKIANRILRKNGKMVLTANQPFTTQLINAQIPNLPHNHNMYWDKMHFANCLLVNKAPVSYVEDILVFSKFSGIIEKSDYSKPHPLRDYFNEELLKSGNTTKEIIDLVGCSASHYFTKGNQFRLPTKEKYTTLQTTGFFNKDFTELKEIHNNFRQERNIEREEYLKKHSEKYPSTFNLWEGNKYKSNILKYKKDYDGHHPTQKPILLLEDLIKTFSNENDLVVDLTMGSGSTGVAAKNTNRSFIGIEQDQNYFKIAEERINKPDLFS